MLTSEDLAAIKQRCDRATEGPWRSVEAYNRGKHDYCMVEAYTAEEDKPGGEDPWYWIADLGTVLGQHDAEFIAHARADVPALLALVQGQAQEIVRLTAWLLEIEMVLKKALSGSAHD